jgi:hypothetical protein
MLNRRPSNSKHGPRHSISSSRASIQSIASTVWQNDDEFYALALYDHLPLDSSLLNFRQGDIIEIVQTEDTGWWAGACGDRVGWLPSEYVEPLSDAMAETLRTVPPELRPFELEAEQLCYKRDSGLSMSSDPNSSRRDSFRRSIRSKVLAVFIPRQTMLLIELGSVIQFRT